MAEEVEVTFRLSIWMPYSRADQKMGKGSTFTADELKALKELLSTLEIQ